MSTIQEGRIYCVFSLILCFGRASVQIMARSAFKLYKCLKILLEFHFNLFSVITNCISHRTKFNSRNRLRDFLAGNWTLVDHCNIFLPNSYRSFP